ncbi:MAG: N-acetyltransferase family protein [Planctomycetota bacterium]
MLRFRMATADDAGAMLAIYGPAVRDTAASFEFDPPTADDMAARVEKTIDRWPWIVAEQRDDTTGELVRIAGYAYAGLSRARAAYQWTCEVSVYVHPDARRLGVGRELYLRLFALLRVQGFCNALAGITLPNDASVALHGGVGFKLVGVYHRVGFKFGTWHDVAWYEVRLADVAAPERTPLTVAEAASRPEWQAALAADVV